MANNNKIRIGITQGDTNGIGYEVILKALSAPEILELCTPVIYGSSKTLTYHRKALEMPSFSINNTSSADHIKDPTKWLGVPPLLHSRPQLPT